MGTSDFLTILTIGVAVWTVIPKKERRFYLLFFTALEIRFLLLGLVFLHFLMGFDWIEDNWIASLEKFRVSGGLSPEIWAYFLALIIISYPVLKVTYGYFPKSNKLEIIKYYEYLLNEREIDLLMEYLQKYHLNHIYSFLLEKSKIKEKDSLDIMLRRRTESDFELEKLLGFKKMNIAAAVYSQILKKENFIRSGASKYPFVFAKVISGMKTRKVADRYFVYTCLEELLKSLNNSFVDELKKLDGAQDSIKERLEGLDLPIMSALFTNRDSAIQNHPWMPVGEVVIKSLKYNQGQVDFLRRDFDSDLEDEVWKYPIQAGIVFFDYMVRESIYCNWGYHMWMFYFRSFIPILIKISPEEDYSLNRSETPKFAHFFIKEIFVRMIAWLKLAKKLGDGILETSQENENTTKPRVGDPDSSKQKSDSSDKAFEVHFNIIDTVKCLGQCFHSIFQASEDQIPRRLKLNLLERIVQIYCEYSLNTANPACIEVVSTLAMFFKNPKGVDSGIPEITDQYKSLLEDVWDEFDKVPFQYDRHDWVLNRFETDVLIPLGILNQK